MFLVARLDAYSLLVALQLTASTISRNQNGDSSGLSIRQSIEVPSDEIHVDTLIAESSPTDPPRNAEKRPSSDSSHLRLPAFTQSNSSKTKRERVIYSIRRDSTARKSMKQSNSAVMQMQLSHVRTSRRQSSTTPVNLPEPSTRQPVVMAVGEDTHDLASTVKILLFARYLYMFS